MEINKEEKINKKGGAREGAGRKVGSNKVLKTFRIDKTLYDEFEKFCGEEKIIKKLEEALIKYMNQK